MENNLIEPEEIDDIITRGRKKTIQKKLGTNKEFIEESDLENLIEKMQLTISKDDIKNLFNRMDVDKTGKVSLEALVESIKKEDENSTNNSYSHVFKKINDELTTKSEKIINKLKKLKNQAIFSNDHESLKDIDW